MGRELLMSADCETCPVRTVRCDDCIVPVVLAQADRRTSADGRLDDEERSAVTLMVRGGLIDVATAARARAIRRPDHDVDASGQEDWATA